MKRKDKELLLRYLSMVLLSGVKCQKFDDNCGYTLLGIDGDVLHIDYPIYDEGDGYIKVDYCKPYLRSLSSIMNEEMNAYTNTGSFLHANGILYNLVYTTEGLLFLLNNHFDIFGLIPRNLAIAVTEENNPYNKQEE